MHAAFCPCKGSNNQWLWQTYHQCTFWHTAVLQYQITLQTHVSLRNVSGNVQIEEVTDYAIRVEDLSFAEDFGCDDELVEYFTNFFNLVQTQSDTKLNIKEAVSFGLIRKKGRYLQHHISTKSTIWKKHQTRLVPSKLQLIVALWKIFQNHWNGVMRRRFQQQNYTSKLYLYCALFTHSRWLSILRVRIALWSTFHYNMLW